MLLRGESAWSGFLRLATSWLFLSLDVLLIFGMLYHGLNGIRVALVGSGVVADRQKALWWALGVIGTILLAFSAAAHLREPVRWPRSAIREPSVADRRAPRSAGEWRTMTLTGLGAAGPRHGPHGREPLRRASRSAASATTSRSSTYIANPVIFVDRVARSCRS